MPIKNRFKFYGSFHLSMNSIMTKQQKLRRTGFAADFNAGDDDFILADLDLMRGDYEPSPVPLAHFMDDDEAIDRLLLTTGFNAGNVPENDAGESDARLIDDINLADDSDFDRFFVEPIEQEEQNQQTDAEESLVLDAVADFDDIALEEDAIDSLLVNAGFDADTEPEPGDGKQDAPVIDEIDSAEAFAGFDRFVVEPFEFVDQPEQHQRTDTEELSVSDAVADFDDIALDEFDVTTSNAAVFNSGQSQLALEKQGADVLMAQEENRAQSLGETAAEIRPEPAIDQPNDPAIKELHEREAIKKLINDCEVKVKKATVISYASLGFGFIALLGLVAMVIVVFSAQTKITKLSDLVTILEEDMGGMAGKNADLLIDNSDASAERLNRNVNGLPERTQETARSTTGTATKKMAVDVTKQAIVKKVSAEKKVPVQNLSTKPSPSSADASKKKVTAPTRVHKANGKSPTKAVPEKKKPVKKLSVATRPVTWSVNLAAYKAPGSAKNKAAKLLQQGVAVKVTADAKNKTIWYRLKVVGFKNKAQATAYSTKIKKSLNLKSVAVGND